MKRTTVKLPDDLDARLRHYAERRGTRISTVVREAIEEYVGSRRLHSFGSGASGRSDLSERIEEILSGEAEDAPESDESCSS